MKNRVILLAITIVTVTAMAFVMAGCSCNKKEKVDPAKLPTESIQHQGKGNNVVEDQFETVSQEVRTTDKQGNQIVKYTNAEGQRVTRITNMKNGMVKVIIKNKKGKVIETKEFRDPTVTTKKSNKKKNKKDNKKEDKKDNNKDNGEMVGGVANDGEWSDFY